MRITWNLMMLAPAAFLLAACTLVPAPARAVPGLDDLTIADQLGTGTASWYGARFAGRPTASGERFDPADYTAAHRDLPFGSRVLVTHVESGRSVVVRINDRGPWGHGRVIDVSEAAAQELGIVRSGTGTVRLDLLAE